MSRPRFLADQDFNEYILTGALRQEPAIEIVRLRELGLDRSDDAEVLKYASLHGMAVLSHDVNTMIEVAATRIRDGEPMHGLFVTDQRGPLAPVIESLVVIWVASEAEEWQGRIVYLPF